MKHKSSSNNRLLASHEEKEVGCILYDVCATVQPLSKRWCVELGGHIVFLCLDAATRTVIYTTNRLGAFPPILCLGTASRGLWLDNGQTFFS